MFKRLIEEKLIAYIESQAFPKNVLLVEGARQVGKTSAVTKVLQAYPNSIQINLETNKIFRDDLDQTKSFEEFKNLLALRYNFEPIKGSILFIDEAQESQTLSSYIRSMKEEWKEVSCILSGSSMSRLFSNETRVPVGRISRLVVRPCNFREFLLAKENNTLLDYLDSFPEQEIPELFHLELLKELDEFLYVGGLPAVINAYNTERNFLELRREILLDQEDDFLRKLPDLNRDLFREALRGIAHNLGSSSKYTHINDKLTDAKTIVSLLREWHLITEVEQRGLSSTTNFNPKRYVYDIGITQDVRLTPFPRLSLLSTLNKALRIDLGGLVENYVCNQIISTSNSELVSWRKNNKEPVEVDFILKDEGLIPIECKAALKVSPRSFQYLKTFLQQSNYKSGILLSAAPYQKIIKDGFTFINIPLYLAETGIFKKIANLGDS